MANLPTTTKCLKHTTCCGTFRQTFLGTLLHSCLGTCQTIGFNCTSTLRASDLSTGWSSPSTRASPNTLSSSKVWLSSLAEFLRNCVAHLLVNCVAGHPYDSVANIIIDCLALLFNHCLTLLLLNCVVDFVTFLLLSI